MSKSKLNDKFQFNENKWVVSLINTKEGIGGVVGGHAKIVVEGEKRDTSSPLSSSLFIAEYHIMENGHLQQETWIPQPLRNTKCNYLVLIKESDNYNQRQEEQYSKVNCDSWYATPDAVREMIQNIKKEQRQILDGEQEAIFEYFGKWSYFSIASGHNCTTWAEEKLAIANVGNGKAFTDSSKAVPAVHVGCSLL